MKSSYLQKSDYFYFFIGCITLFVGLVILIFSHLLSFKYINTIVERKISNDSKYEAIIVKKEQLDTDIDMTQYQVLIVDKNAFLFSVPKLVFTSALKPKAIKWSNRKQLDIVRHSDRDCLCFFYPLPFNDVLIRMWSLEEYNKIRMRQ